MGLQRGDSGLLWGENLLEVGGAPDGTVLENWMEECVGPLVGGKLVRKVVRAPDGVHSKNGSMYFIPRVCSL